MRCLLLISLCVLTQGSAAGFSCAHARPQFTECVYVCSGRRFLMNQQAPTWKRCLLRGWYISARLEVSSQAGSWFRVVQQKYIQHQCFAVTQTLGVYDDGTDRPLNWLLFTSWCFIVVVGIWCVKMSGLTEWFIARASACLIILYTQRGVNRFFTHTLVCG